MKLNLKLKKIIGLFCWVMTMGIVLTGCQFSESPQRPGSKDLRVGMLLNLNISEKQQAAIIKQVGVRGGIDADEFPAITYYDNLNAMQLGLDSGSIDAMSTYNSVADYLMVRNPKYELTEFDQAGLADSFCSAVREEDTALLADMNRVIAAMQNDGTLDQLVRKYIREVDKGADPPAVPLEKIPGAPTIKIAVTGDLPPIDLVRADGSPAGFNTAVLAEVSRRLQKNIELIQIDSSARAAALTSKRADAVFWAVVPAEDFAIRPPDLDKVLGVATTTPYYRDEIVHVRLKK